MPRTCSGTYQYEEVQGIGVQPLCVYGSLSGMQMGMVSEYGVRLAVRYPFEEAFHTVEGLCTNQADCHYSQAADTLVNAEFTPFGYVGYMHKEFSKRLSPFYNVVTGVKTYRFNSNGPKVVVGAKDDSMLAGLKGISLNGE